MNDLRAKILWWAAKRRIAKDGSKVIAVGGAIAKTSTKAALGTALRLAYPGQVRVGYGNLNTYLGVPLSILGFEIDFYDKKIGIGQWLTILIKAIWRGLFVRLPKYLVLEYGTDGPGDIAAITDQLPPDIGLITIVGPAHLANYPLIDDMVKDEGYIAERTKSSGFVLVNSGDQYLTEHYNRAKARVVNVVCSLEEISVKFMQVFARELKINESIIKQATEDFSAPARRFNYEKLGDITLLDDSYNASPLAVKAALHLLKKLPPKRVAILGSMLELGANSSAYHQEVGDEVKKIADTFIAVGADAKDYGAPIWYATSAEAAEKIVDHIGESDSVLVKGSKGVHMEIITAAIRKHYKREKNGSVH